MLSAQEGKKNKENSPTSERAKLRSARLKWKEERKTKMTTDNAIKKHHRKIQSKSGLKSMRKLKKKSNKLRSNKK